MPIHPKAEDDKQNGQRLRKKKNDLEETRNRMKKVLRLPAAAEIAGGKPPRIG
jgi:hypothetical protein